MSKPSRTLRRTALLALTPGVVLAGPLAVPAAAEPPAPDTTLAVFALARLWTPVSTATSATVCAEGQVDDGTPTVGQWTFRVVGATSTFVDPRGGATYTATCHAFTTAGAPAGTTDASITYVGVGGDVLADCTATASWAPGVRLTWVWACTPTRPVAASSAT